MQTTEYDIITEEEETFQEYVVNAQCSVWYNKHYACIKINQPSNSGSGDVPRTFSYSIPSQYAPRFATSVPSFTLKNGEPYAMLRCNSNGSCELIITIPTYSSSGGTTISATLFYPRKQS